MAKFIAKERLQAAVESLAALRERVPSQGIQHIFPLLALKKKGASSGTELQFEEQDDFDFWDAYFLVDDKSYRPYYDPFTGERRIASHPHSNVATARKGTFQRSWHAAESRVTDEGETMWMLSDGYLSTVREKCLTKSGVTTLLPANDLVVWLRRTDAFVDDVSIADLIDAFKSEFNFTTKEFDALFDVQAENAASTFASQPISPDDVLGIVGEPPLPAATAAPPAPEEFSADLTLLLSGLALTPGLVEQALAALSVGSHLILAGPPGTGKSTLAERLATAATRSNYTAGYKTATATADWTTFDTVGGYMPTGAGNELVFRAGIVLQAIAEDNWCIIDELNRANIDRAIGALITLIGGSEETAIVELPFRHRVGSDKDSRLEPVRIRRDMSRDKSGLDEDSGDYVVGRNWRLLATMNTYDRSNLFPLTAAFARRFATVVVGAPPADSVLGAFGVSAGAAEGVFRLIMQLLDGDWLNPRPLGPAIVKDAWRYTQRRLQASSSMEMAGALREALELYVLPQYSGLDEAWPPLRDRIAEVLASSAPDDERDDAFQRNKDQLDTAFRGIEGNV